MKVVVDTSVAIDFLRRRDADESLYSKLSGKVEMVFSLITVAELYSGKSAQENGSQKKILEEMLAGIDIIIPTIEIAKEVGKLRAVHNLSLADAFVASLALDLNLSLVTLNKKDFEKIKALKLYTHT